MNKKEIFLIAILFLAISVISVLEVGLPKIISTSPDGNALDFFISLQASEGRLKYLIEETEFGDLIHTRSSVFVNGAIVPLSFLGELIIKGNLIGSLGLDISKLPIIETILGVVLFAYLFLISKLVFKEENIFPFLLIFAFLFAGVFSLITTALTFFVISLYYYLKYIDTEKIHYSILFALFGIISLTLRYDYLVLFVPLFIIEVFIKRKKAILPLLTQIGVFLIIGGSLILYMNSQLYGSPFLTGYNFDYQARDSSLVAEGENPVAAFAGYLLPFGVNPSSIVDKIAKFIILLFPISLFTIAGFLYSARKKGLVRVYLIIFLSIALIITVYYGSNPNFYGFDSVTYHSSYVRYFSPIYFLGILFIIPYIRKTHFPKISSMVILFAVIMMGLIMNFQAVTSLSNQLDKYTEIKQEIIEVTEEDSIIFTYYWDKILWPDRLTATASKSYVYEKDLFIPLNNELSKRRIFIFPDSIYYNTIQECYEVSAPITSSGMREVVSFSENCNPNSNNLLPELTTGQ